jgi:hypothetical protein
LGAFVDALYAAEPKRVARVVEICRKKLKSPPLDKAQYVAVLVSHGCTGLAKALSNSWNVECPEMAKDGTLYFDAGEPRRTRSATKNAAKRRAT